jgi:hypothetical protein
MSCSYCHVAGHRVTNCQSADLLRLMDKLEGIVRDLKRQPLTYMDSHALNLHSHICDLDVNEVRGVSAKLGICITGKPNKFLRWCIVKRIWSREEPDYVLSLCDFIYLRHLDRMIGGMHHTTSWAEYAQNITENSTLIKGQMRIFNIARMRTLSTFYDDMLRDDMPGFLEFIHPLRRREGLLRLFGGRINLTDVCDHIPAIRRFYRRNEFIPTGPTSSFTWGQARQNLELSCEYVATLEKTAEEGCAICISDTKCDTILNCGHMFCIDCMVTTVKTALENNRYKLTCAMCRTETKCIKSTDSIKIENLTNLLK